jgi:hypothetical protein
VDGGAQGRHGWVVLSYFFLGALLGLFVTTISAIFFVNALLLGGGGGEVTGGAVLAALVGLVVLYTHLTQGLKLSREQFQGEQASGDAATGSQSTPPPPPQATSNTTPLWPGAVYFRVAALVGLITAVAGAVGMSGAIASEIFGGSDIPQDFTGYPGLVDNKEAILSGLLTTVVGLLVMWWHLTEARKREQ